MTTLSMRASSLTVLTVISTLNSLASAAMHSPFRRARGWTRLVESVCVVECINEDPSGRLYRLPLPNKYCIPPHIMCKGGEYVIEESVPKAERAEREARCRCSDWHLKKSGTKEPADKGKEVTQNKSGMSWLDLDD